MIDVHWLAGAYLLASIALWVAAERLRAGISGTRQLSAWLHSWPGDLLRFAYYVGLPYAALIFGVVPAPYLGLAGMRHLSAADRVATDWSSPTHIVSGLWAMARDWLPGLLMAGSLTLGIGLLVGLAWLCLARFRTRAWMLPTFESLADTLGDRVLPTARYSSAGSVPFSLLRNVYQAVHWSFYRGLAWQMTDNLYLAAALGVILVGLEWCFSPGWVSRLRYPPDAASRLLDAALLILTAGLFCYVQNVWALVLVQYALTMAANRSVAGASRFRSSV